MDGFPLFPDQASTHAGQVDLLFFFMMAVATFFTLLVAGGLIYFGVKYRRRHADEIPLQTTANSRIETVGMAVLLSLTMVPFFWGAWLYLDAAKPVESATEIFVVGKQWMWKIEYPDGQSTINELYVPAGRPIRLTMTSQDVIHSFFVPAFRLKQDVVPGRYTTLNFTPTQTGEFHLFCTEYCGLNHSRMIGTVYVLEPADFEAWLAGGGTTTQDPKAAGEALFGSLGCQSCHLPTGAGPGPSLQGLFGTERPLEGGETIIADASYINSSILRPQEHIAAGYPPIMPTYEGQVSQEQIIQLIAYIRSIGSSSTTTDGAADGNGNPAATPATDNDGSPTTEQNTPIDTGGSSNDASSDDGSSSDDGGSSNNGSSSTPTSVPVTPTP